MEPCSLVSLPLELFCDISSLIDCFDVGRLWFCGDRGLNRKLKLGIHKFELCVRRRASWPLLVIEFVALRRFSLTYVDKEPAFVQNSVLMPLPASVTGLCLTDVFLPKILHSNPEILDRLHHFHLIAIECNLSAVSEQLNAINFPIFELESPLTSNPHLLKTVTKLKLCNTKRVRTAFEASDMPRLTELTLIGLSPLRPPFGLTRLHVQHHMLECDLKALPSTVTDLLYRPISPTMPGFRQTLKLPLVSLELEFNRAQIQIPEADVIDCALAQQIPTSMTKMSLNSIHLCIDAFPFLPKSLRHIGLGKTGRLVLPPGAAQKEDTSVRFLPEGLESFSCDSPLRLRPIWPSSMRHIDIQINLTLLLPQESEENGDSKENRGLALPTHLEALKVISLWNHYQETKIFPPLPTHMRRLGVSFPYPLDFSLGSWLPPNLEHLLLMASAIPSDDPISTSQISLPKTLISLEISGGLSFISDSIFKDCSLPSLTSLYTSSPLERPSLLLELRTPELTSLKVSMAATINWKDIAFLHLKRLRTLFISPHGFYVSDDNWPEDWVQRFPPRLMDFTFPSQIPEYDTKMSSVLADRKSVV